MPDFLAEIASVSGVKLRVIEKFVREMYASPDCEAFDVAISRYQSIVRWFSDTLDLKILPD